jgi:hypothetical protein
MAKRASVCDSIVGNPDRVPGVREALTILMERVDGCDSGIILSSHSWVMLLHAPQLEQRLGACGDAHHRDNHRPAALVPGPEGLLLSVERPTLFALLRVTPSSAYAVATARLPNLEDIHQISTRRMAYRLTFCFDYNAPTPDTDT